ncbi:uncharacterized protein LOC114538193 [Dendronephthya gigantea]|uniref:uncharacterized protein LOC114538193 n=1 Tax=Dendronephthya gigantea TaxID=151771 RepID=UPI00106BC0D0|nr:uncharacterized protein LOC114538193 [Dendronephthya gigantea]
MHAAGRNEAQTEHVLHWNKLKILKLPVTLCKEYVYVKKLIEENKKELDELVNELNLSAYREEFGNWAAEITACGKRSKFEMTKREGDLVSYYELYTEVREAIALKPFLDVAGDEAETEINDGNSGLYAQALAKHQEMDKKEKKLRNLESTLCIVGNELGKQQALQEGKNLLAVRKRISIREVIEMLCFSISQQKKNISRLAGLSIHLF